MTNKKGNEPFDKIAKIPTWELNKKINALRFKDVRRGASIDFLKTCFSDLINFQFYFLNAFYYPFYFRARNTLEKNISQLMNPAPELVEVYGRCNDLNESLFYCSNCYVTSILEIKPKLNDTVTVLMLRLDDNTLDQNNFLPLVTLAKSALNEDFLSSFVLCGNPDSTNSKLELIGKLFDEIMIQDVKVGEEWKYKKSIALTKAFFDNHKSHPMAIAFPSKASKHFGVNFAIQPSWIDNLRNPTYKAFRIKIVDLKSDFNGVGLITEIATEMDNNGDFIFNDVSPLQQYITLNSSYYEAYEKMFSYQKTQLGENAFFQRYYPPPHFKYPFNLLQESQIILFDEKKPFIPKQNFGQFPMHMIEPNYAGKPEPIKPLPFKTFTR
jgi:hypothetical protein